MPQIAVDIDISKPVAINLVCHSPHVVTYRMWQRAPDDENWATVAEGHTSDDVPDHASAGPLARGWKYAFHLIIVGHASTDFLVSVALSQDGRAVPGATFIEQGVLDSTRRAVRKKTVVLA